MKLRGCARKARGTGQWYGLFWEDHGGGYMTARGLRFFDTHLEALTWVLFKLHLVNPHV